MQAYDRLDQTGVKIYSVKPDCFTIPAESEAKAREVLSFDSGIGSWRVTKTEDIIFPFDNLNRDELEDIEFKHFETHQLAVNNEWDVNEMCDHFEKHRGVMVRAEFAGCGKTFACKAMEARGHKVLFVCPTNKLAQNNIENDNVIARIFKFSHSLGGAVGHTNREKRV